MNVKEHNSIISLGALFLFLLIPIFANADIKIRPDTVSGKLEIYIDNPQAGPIFKKSGNKCLLLLNEQDSDCCFFKDPMEMVFNLKGLWKSNPVKIIEKNYKKQFDGQLCHSSAILEISEDVRNLILTSDSVIVKGCSTKKKNLIEWKIPETTLVEWKKVARCQSLENFNFKNLSTDSLHKILSDTNFFPKEAKLIKVQQQPQLIKRVDPVYPIASRDAGREGTVILAALIGKDGKIKKVRVVKTIGADQAIEDAAVRAAYENVYKPAMENNEPVEVWIYYPVNFMLR